MWVTYFNGIKFTKCSIFFWTIIHWPMAILLQPFELCLTISDHIITILKSMPTKTKCVLTVVCEYLNLKSSEWRHKPRPVMIKCTTCTLYTPLSLHDRKRLSVICNDFPLWLQAVYTGFYQMICTIRYPRGRIYCTNVPDRVTMYSKFWMIWIRIITRTLQRTLIAIDHQQSNFI